MLLTKENIDNLFNMFDIDGDKNISISELREIFCKSKNEKEGNKAIKEIIQEVDVNNDN